MSRNSLFIIEKKREGYVWRSRHFEGARKIRINNYVAACVGSVQRLM